METINYEGKNYKIFNVTTDYCKDRVICVPLQYGNKTLAIRLLCVEGNQVTAPFATLTVNLCQPSYQNDTDAFVDTNNNPFAEEFIEKNKIGMSLDLVGSSGYCLYPLYRFNLEALTV